MPYPNRRSAGYQRVSGSGYHDNDFQGGQGQNVKNAEDWGTDGWGGWDEDSSSPDVQDKGPVSKTAKGKKDSDDTKLLSTGEDRKQKKKPSEMWGKDKDDDDDDEDDDGWQAL